jgi:uncharacterized repeat protein (TIGR01451 family)
LVFRAILDEGVQNVGTADFLVDSASTAVVSSVNQVSASVYDVTVSGGDLAGFNGTVGVDLAGGQDITDLAGNALPTSEPTTDETYTLDNDAPGLTSFAWQTPATSPTNADTLIFRATFDEDVQNVDTADFSVDSASTAMVSSVSQVSASVYDVTVSGGDLAGFNGMVGVDLAGGQDITDLVGNALPAGEPSTNQTYTLDNDAPGLISFARQTPATSPTNADTLGFRVSFDEGVQNVSAADFSVSGTTAGVTGVAVVIADTVFDVTVSGGDLAGLNGTVGLDLAGGQDIADLVGNALPTSEPTTDETYVVDNDAPGLTSFARQTPGTSPTNADTLVFRAILDEGVQNVGTADFSVDSASTAVVSSVNQVSASVYDVTVSGGDLAGFNGTVGLDLAIGQDIADLAGNALPAGEPGTDETYTLDNDAPGLTSFARQTPAMSPTNADTLVFRVTFDEGVQNVGTADFSVDSASTAGVSTVNRVSASVYDVTVSGGDLAGFNGTMGLDLATGQDITDLVGNALPTSEPTTDETYTLDNNAPGLISFARQTPATSPTNADTLVFRAAFDEDVQNVGTADFSVDSASTAVVSNVNQVSASVYDVTVSGGDLAGFNGTVGLDLATGQDIADLVGNALPTSEPATDETYTLDNDAPGLTSFARQTPATSPTNADTLVFRAAFDEGVQNVGTADFSVDSASTAGVSNLNRVSASVYDVTVSGGDLAGFNGTVSLDLATGQDITDLAGNALPAGEPGKDQAYLVDNVAPTPDIDQATGQTDPTSNQPINFEVDFGESVTGFTASDLIVGGTAPGPKSAVVSGGPSSYSVAVSGLTGHGTATLGVGAGAAQDLAGNTSNASTATDNQVTFITPDLVISKSVTPDTANPGDLITYTIAFSNTGTYEAGGVVITDLVPVSVTGASVLSSGVAITDTGASPPYVWDVADLAVGEGGVITITGQLSATLATGTFTNTAVITTTALDGDPGNNSSEAGVTVIASDLVIAKTVDPTTANPGDLITYTIAFSNTGTDVASDVVISDAVPVSVTVGSVLSSGVAITDIGASPSYVWDAADLAVGEWGVITITGQLSATLATGTFTNTAVITTTALDSDPGSNSSEAGVTVIASDLVIAKTVDPVTASPGDPITYTITFSNTGTDVASDVVITDLVPVSVTITSVISSGVAITDTRASLPYVWYVADLAVGQRGVITITGQLSATLPTTTFTNTVVVATTAVDEDVANNSGDAGVVVLAPGATVETATGTGIAEFWVGGGGIQGLAAVAGGTLSCPEEDKADLSFVHGFFSFNITGLTPCASETVVVTITLPSAVPPGTEYWKCHDGAWLDVTPLLGDDDGDNVLTLTLTDGRRGDDDGVCNGVIVDDGGPGIPAVVGGITMSVNRLELLGPWLGWPALIVLASVPAVLCRGRRGWAPPDVRRGRSGRQS